MKNLLAIVALFLAINLSAATAQTTPKKQKDKAKTEQVSSTETAAPARKSCCASHGSTKVEAAPATNEVKTATTSHEHAGAMCDPKNCTEAQKKQCAGAKNSGKGCCMGAAKPAEKAAPQP